MPLKPGDKLGPYEILAPIGAGGMGEVYRARDPRLNRDVAIKVSAAQFTDRFEREAQAIAALNHPNICTLHDVGPDYLVMEYVDGKPIQGPLAIEEALRMAGQILDAMDAAHLAGITHRDLKPGNILVGKNGVKVLDFGLAIFERSTPERGRRSDASAETVPLTGEGTVVGTPHYMAPEQLEGKQADARSDIFSFGLVLYELIGGKRAFTGSNQASLVAAILKEQPRPLREIQPLTPAGLEQIIETCLEKDPGKRWQSAREIKHALGWMLKVTPAPAASQKTPLKVPRLGQFVAVLVAMTAIGIAAWMSWSKPGRSAQTTRLQVVLPEKVILGRSLSLSPDGRKLVIEATGEEAGLWVRDLDALAWRKLPGALIAAANPFWSPDSQFVGFTIIDRLVKIDIAGGAAQTLSEQRVALGSGSWSREGTIAFGDRGRDPLWKISQAGGAVTAITSVDTARGEISHSRPSFLPDGKHFLYVRNGSPEVRGTYVGSIDAKPEKQSEERLIASESAVSYANGYLFFMREKTLMAQPFDADRIRLSGEPVPAAEQVEVFSVSDSTLAYRNRLPDRNYQVTWWDRQGKPTGTVETAGANQTIVLSPDGTRGAVREENDLWIVDFARGGRTRVTFLRSVGSDAIWSPDGNRVAFAAGTINADTIFEKATSGAGREKELLKEPGQTLQPTSWSRDGRFLLYTAQTASKTGSDLWVLPLEGGRKPVLLLGSEFNEFNASFSPDSHWIAYISNESRSDQVYVRPFLASGPIGVPALGEGKWQISTDGGYTPKWRADGKEIFFSYLIGRMMAVEVKTNGDVFEADVPHQLFLAPATLFAGWDVTPDGKRFLLSVPQAPGGAQMSVNVVLNWRAMLKN
ncbi:MAG: protein kinase [Acidobacteriia bacterium]|nr:protein kinase [Terriglobia bacterium]